MNIIVKILSTTLAKKVAVAVLKELAKRTDNKIDDEIVKIIENSV